MLGFDGGLLGAEAPLFFARLHLFTGNVQMCIFCLSGGFCFESAALHPNLRKRLGRCGQREQMFFFFTHSFHLGLIELVTAAVGLQYRFGKLLDCGMAILGYRRFVQLWIPAGLQKAR